jgi:hypothetical protein
VTDSQGSQRIQIAPGVLANIYMRIDESDTAVNANLGGGGKIASSESC